MKPLNGLTGLEWVSFYESTNILDGDLSPLLRQKNLSRVGIQRIAAITLTGGRNLALGTEDDHYVPLQRRGRPGAANDQHPEHGQRPADPDPASLVLPSGFSLVTPFAATVAPGGSTSLVLELDAAAEGNYTGQVTFNDNDPANASFSFSAAGTVIARRRRSPP